MNLESAFEEVGRGCTRFGLTSTPERLLAEHPNIWRIRHVRRKNGRVSKLLKMFSSRLYSW